MEAYRQQMRLAASGNSPPAPLPKRLSSVVVWDALCLSACTWGHLLSEVRGAMSTAEDKREAPDRLSAALAELLDQGLITSIEPGKPVVHDENAKHTYRLTVKGRSSCLP